MIVDISKSTEKKKQKLPYDINRKVSIILDNLTDANDLTEVQSSKLAGTKDRYKIRAGDYQNSVQKDIQPPYRNYCDSKSQRHLQQTLRTDFLKTERILHRKDAKVSAKPIASLFH